MISVDFSNIELKFKKKEDKIWVWDIIRKQYILLTPEEWVRQNFIRLLIHDYQYTPSLFRVETGLYYDKRQKRSDILVYDRLGKPFLLVECKSMEINLSEDTLRQVSEYNHIIQSKHIAITNGIFCSIFEMNYETQQFQSLSQIPFFS